MYFPPDIDVLVSLNQSGVESSESASGASSARKSSSNAIRIDPDTETGEDGVSNGEDNAPLFYCPGKQGFYSPRQGKGALLLRRDPYRSNRPWTFVQIIFCNAIVCYNAE